MRANANSKNFSDSYLFNKSSEYEKKIYDFLMKSTVIDKSNTNFDDIKYEVKKRQVTLILSKVLDSPQVVLLHNINPMPKAFKVFTAKDVANRGDLKVFIDCSECLKLINGRWASNNIDILISYLVSAMTQVIYYNEPQRLLTNDAINRHGARAFSSLFTHIVDYLFKISNDGNIYDGCKYLTCIYYYVVMMNKDHTSESVRNAAKKLSNISDRQASTLDLYIDEDSFMNIKNFIATMSKALKLSKLDLEVVVDKWIYLYGKGTHFGLELFPAFASILTDAYVGGYINQQKTIEKITGTDMTEFSRAIFRVGENS